MGRASGPPHLMASCEAFTSISLSFCLPAFRSCSSSSRARRRPAYTAPNYGFLINYDLLSTANIPLQGKLGSLCVHLPQPSAPWKQRETARLGQAWNCLGTAAQNLAALSIRSRKGRGCCDEASRLPSGAATAAARLGNPRESEFDCRKGFSSSCGFLQPAESDLQKAVERQTRSQRGSTHPQPHVSSL